MVRPVVGRLFAWQAIAGLVVLALLVAHLVLPSQNVRCAVLDWDADGAWPVDGGTGGWDTTNPFWYDATNLGYVAWNNTNNDDAVFGHSAGTVTLGTGITVRNLTFNTAGYTIAGNTLTLSGSPFITTNGDAVINSILAGTGFTKAGTGRLTLGTSTNTFTGNILVTAGTLSMDADARLGNAANDIFLTNNAVLQQTANASVALGSGRFINIGTGGGTIDVVQTGPTGKLLLSTAGQLTGSNTLTKTGAGTLQLSVANTGFTGAVALTGGQIEIQNTQALGTSPPAVTVSGGELVMTNLTWAGNIALSGGMISGNSGNSTYSGTLAANASFSVGLRDFNAPATGRTVTLSGTLTGPGDMTLVGPTTGTGTLLVAGNISGFTGTTTLTGNTTLSYRGASMTVADPGVNGLNAYYYNIGAAGVNAGTDNRFAIDQLYITPRVITRVETDFGAAGVPGLFNMGNPDTDYPPTPVVGFQVPDNLAMMWKGLLNIDTAGNYTFRVRHDDGMVLYIDGVPVVDRGAVTGSPAPDAVVTLAAGSHSIVVKFAQGGGGKYFTMNYAGPDTGGSYQVLGSTPGTLTTGSVTPIARPEIILPNAATAVTNTVDITADSTTPGITLGANNTLAITSPTISTLTVTGASTLTTGGTGGTLAPSSGALVFNASIGESVSGSNLAIAGPYLTRFNAVNTYTGTTTVTGGRLELNATGGNAISGNLDLNAANAGGLVANVQLQQSNQIADTAALSVRNNSVLDLGAYNETVATLSLQNYGRIIGSGTLTVNNLAGSTFSGGTIAANLAGSGNLTVNTTTNRVVLLGNNLYTGTTTVTAGSRLVIGSNNALGVSGALASGNDTTVNSGGQLQLLGNLTTTEAITAGGTGVAAQGATTGALWNVGGWNTLAGGLFLSGDTTVYSSGGNVILGAVNPNGPANANLTVDGAGGVTLATAPNLGPGGIITKNGTGALVFGYTLSGIPANVTHNAGALGFNGPQNLGAVAIPANLAYLFNSDPGAGTTVLAPGGTAVIATYAADQALVSRIAGASAGTFALAVNSGNSLNVSGTGLGLGALGLVTYSGTLTPNATGYRFSGVPTGIGDGIAPNRLSLTQPLVGANPMAVDGGILDLSRLAGAQSGVITVSGGAVVEIVNNQNLGTQANGVALDGGALRLSGTSGSAGAIWGQLGNTAAPGGAARVLTIGPDGGTVDVRAQSLGNTGWTLMGDVGAGSVDPLVLAGGAPSSTTFTKTGLGYLFLGDATSFGGTIVIAPNGGYLDIRGKGQITNAAKIVINSMGQLRLENNGGLGAARQVTSEYQPDRVADSIPIEMNGGYIWVRARNSTTQRAETFGTVTLASGQNFFYGDREGQGVEITVNNLVRSVGATIRFDSEGGVGGTGDDTRVFLTQVNGTTPNATHIGGWATILGVNFAGYGATGVVINNGTAQGAAAFTPVAGTIYNLNAAGTATINDETDNVVEMLALRFGNNAAQTLAFADANDWLYVGSGGILSDGSSQTRAIGSSTTRGYLTAGLVTGSSGTQELFFHNNSNTMTVHSVIVDNPNGGSPLPVAVVKDLDGQVNLEAAANSYTGGTYVTRGTLEARAAGTLGSGAVVVKNAQLNLNAAGAINTASATGGYTAVDGSRIYLNGSGNYSTTWDRFTIESGSILGGQSGTGTTANQGLNSLTRVASLTGGGQVVLASGAIVGHNSHRNDELNGTGVNTIQNLGLNADLYYGLTANFNQPNGAVTVGAGTPWMGISTDRSSRVWQQGTMYATSDFWLQGQTRDNGYAALILGGDMLVGSYAIVNQAGRSINAYVAGQVLLAEDTPMELPSDLTFVVTSGAVLQPNKTNSFGYAANAADRAKVRVLAGGTLDAGSYTPINPYNDPTQYGKQYPLASPINTHVTVEAGGRLLINDASGIGASDGGALWTIQTDGVLDLGHANVFFGSNDGLINPGQFVFEPGAIIRLTNDNRYYKLDQFVNQAANGQQLVYEIFNSDKSLTEAVNPFIIPTVGTPTVVRQNFTIGAGGVLTNDASDRTLRNRRGSITLLDGAILAGTNQTNFNIQQSLTLQSGANVVIGLDRYVDGMPKLGAVQLTGPNSNIGDASNTFTVMDGAQLAFGNATVFPDRAHVHLPAAVTLYPAPGGQTFQPGNGSTLLLNSNGSTEFIGMLTGAGSVLSGVTSTGAGVSGGLAVGYGVTGDFIFDGVIKSTASDRNPQLTKVGVGRLTLTNTHDSLGQLTVYEGEVVLSGANARWGGSNSGVATELRVARGGALTFDNSTVAVADRQNLLGGGNDWLTTLGGGEFRLLGHATQVADVAMFGLANSGGTGIHGYSGGNSGGFGMVTVTPNGDLSTLRTSLTFGEAQRFDNTGERNSVWLLRGAGLAGLPGTYSASGVYTPNAANPKDGLVFITLPRFTGGATFNANGLVLSNVGYGIVHGAPGTPVVPVRGDLLGAVSPTATEGDFVTIDITGTGATNRTGVRILQASEYTTSLAGAINAPTGLNVRASGALAVTGDTRFQVLKLDNGSSVTVSGTLPNLAQRSQLVLNAGGILVSSGATASINASSPAIVRTAGGVSAYVHAFGDLNVNGEFFSDVALVKTGGGTATFAAGSLTNLRGRIVVHDGVLRINDSLANVRDAALTAQSFNGIYLELNHGTLDINGNDQLFGRFESGNILAGAATEGGTLTSSTAARVTLMHGGTFSGQITGPISLDKVGNNTWMLTNSSPVTGDMTVRQGTVLLRDQGALSNVGQFDLNYARLDVDNGWLEAAGYVDRLKNGVTLNMRGGDFVNRGRAGTLTQEHLGVVNLLQGHNLIQTLAGGGGATETYIANLVRTPGATVSFQQSHGFVGTAGNDSTAIRYLPALINGSAPTLVNNILPAWLIVNNDHFATWNPTTGISSLGNTEDGYANYDSTDLGAAAATHNVNDGSSRTIAASKTVNAIRNAPGATQTITLNSGVQLAIASGGLLTNANYAITYTGGSITSGTGELNVFVQQNTTTIASQITGDIALTKAGQATLRLQGNNNYTGATYVGQGSSGASSRQGTLELNTTGADGSATVAVPGDLHIHNATVSELLPHQISATANVYLYGGALLNLRDAAGVTETLNSLTFANAGGDANARPIVQRANQRADSTLNLTGAVAITANNDNPVSTPALGQNLGRIAFTGAAGAPQTLMVNSPVTINGLSAAGLILNVGIIDVPAGVDDGGLVKAGDGLLIMGGTGVTTTFGNPTSPTEVFNIQSGYVRVQDRNDVLGPVNAITTVQNGAVLLFNGGTGVTGSLQLKDGATMGVTLSSTTLGAVGSTGTVEVASGATVDVQLRDYFVPSTNTANIVVNHKLTGGGTINLTGIEYAAGYNGGGLFQLRNTANDFSGTIRVNTNAVLEANSNTGSSGSTFGTGSIELAGGVLRVRDNNSVNYGNNVTLSADSMIDIDRQGGSNINNTITFGRLTLSGTAGTKHVLSTPYVQGHPIAGNGFRAAFTDVDGAATLVKGGTRFIDLNGYAAGFSGNIEVAGPIGLNLSTSGNLVLNAATNTINNFTVGGFHTFVGGKTANINNTLLVSNNAGQVLNGWAGADTGGIVGSVLVASGATVNAANLTNHGLISSSGGAASISATTLAGTGRYFTFGTGGSPQDLTVNGRLADDGATPTTLTVAGTNTTTIVPTASGTSTGGTQVQKGVLRVAPTASVANPLGVGDIKVYGWNATAAGVFSQPVAANAAELRFDGGANPITQDSNIANHGLVRVTAGGNVTINGSIAGSAASAMTAASFFDNTIPGLLEGRITTTTGQPDTVTSASDFGTGRVANNGNFGVWLEPRMGQMNVVTQDPRTGWSDNTTWIYTGYFYDADGVFAFAENIDDNVMISIDGITRLNNSGSNITSTATKTGQRGATEALNSNTANVADLITAAQPLAANPNLPAGWHTLEIRFYNGTGGAGPWGVSNGFTNNYGLGFNPDGTMALDGTQFFRPIDPGDGSLFRTAVYGKGDVQVDAGATLNVARITATNQLTMAAASLGAVARVTGGTHGNASDVDSLVTTGSSGSATIITDAAVTLTTANLALAAGTTLNKAGVGDLVVNGGNPGLGAGSILAATAGKVLVNGTLQGTAGLVRVDDGATLGGTGTIQSPVIVNFGGTHAPGASVGSQTVGGETWMPGGRFEFELNDAAGTAGGPSGWDLLTVANGTSTGTLDLSGLSESNRFIIDIVSLAGTAPGNAAGFNPTVPIEWEFVTYEQLVGAFSPDLFELDHSRFTNNLGAGHFTIVQTTSGLAISFIPEPSTMLMCAVALLLLFVRRRR